MYACVCQVIRFSIIDPLVTPIAANNSTFSVVCNYVCITTNCLGWGEWVGGLREGGRSGACCVRADQVMHHSLPLPFQTQGGMCTLVCHAASVKEYNHHQLLHFKLEC